MVRKQHAFVRGIGSADVEGKERIKYNAADGELQKWVAATLFLGVCKAREAFRWPCWFSDESRRREKKECKKRRDGSYAKHTESMR